jgi:hypothetical protein
MKKKVILGIPGLPTLLALMLIFALAFTGCDNGTNPVTVTAVTVSPTAATVAKGGTLQFTATVTGTGNPAQTVTWNVSGGKTGTAISMGGILSVASDETAATLTVRATSSADTAKSGTAAVTVTGGDGGGSGEILVDERHQLEKAGNVKVTALPGANVITWDSVRYATHYYVIREEEGLTKEHYINPDDLGGSKNWYADKSNYSNELRDGREYTYYVVAEEGYGIYAPSKSDGKKVIATIPEWKNDATNPIKIPAAADIHVNRVFLDSADFLEVYWTDDSVEAALTNYDVEYRYGQGESDFTALKLNNTFSFWVLNPIRRAVFPYLGDAVEIRIIGYWGEGYYAPKEQRITGNP